MEENEGEDEEDVDGEAGGDTDNDGGDNPWDIDGDEDEGMVEPVEPSGAAFGQVNPIK